MRLSLAFTGMAPLATTLPAVRAAEHYGLDGVWAAEHIGFHDAIVPSAVYLREAPRLEIGVVGLSVAGRHPGVIAMELASLAELAPGRVRVQVGTGDPGLVATLGKGIDAPARATEGLVRGLRSALEGGAVHVEHPGFAFRGFKLAAGAAQVPIDVMAVRPRMLATAARVADGVSLSVGASRRYLSETVASLERELAAAGRERAGFRITALAVAVIEKDLDAARQGVLPLFAAAEPGMAEHLARGVIEPGALVAAAGSGRPLAPLELFTPDVIDALALVTTPDDLGDALAAYAATGIDELALALFAPPEAQPAIVEQLARARPRPGGTG